MYLNTFECAKVPKGYIGHISCKRDGEKVSLNPVIDVGEVQTQPRMGFKPMTNPPFVKEELTWLSVTDS